MTTIVKIFLISVLAVVGLYSGIIGIQLLITTIQSLGTTADIAAIMTLPLGIFFILLSFGAFSTIYYLLVKKKK